VHGPECVILVRHGRSTWSGQDRFIGQLDVPLSAEGIGDAEHVAAEVAKLMPDQLVSSDMLRARDTAVAIGRRCGNGRWTLTEHNVLAGIQRSGHAPRTGRPER